MSVEKDGGRTVVTLLGGDRAKSAAIVNPSYDVALQHLAGALNKVPGRVMVEGGTDNQPIKSLSVSGTTLNYRANVRSAWSPPTEYASRPARLTSTGAGASKPRYLPESDPANRARNRRVEIVHIRGM